MEQVFTNKEHGSAMMKSLSQLWKGGRYCDAVLEVGSHKLEFHKLVLVACSPFVLGSPARESDTGKLILKLKGDEEDVEAAKACLQYMYEGVVQLTEDNVDNVVGIARVLHLEDLVMYCSSFQELVKNMKKLKKSLSDEGNPKTNKKYELLIKNEKCATKSALKDTAHSITVGQSAFEMSTENAAPDSGDDYHSDFEQNRETSNNSDTEKDNGFNEVGGKIESFIVKQEPGSDISDVEGHNEDNDMSDNADSDDSYAPKIKKKKQSPQVSKSKARRKTSLKIIKETEQFTVVKNENDNSFGETEQGEANTDIQTNKVGGEYKKRWQCKQCSKSYSQAGKLAFHRKKVHEGTAPVYECELCGARFISKQNNIRHFKIVHQGFKAFPCTECDNAFASKASLTGHLLKTHSIGTTPSCDKCGKSFYHAKNLNDHKSRCGRKPKHECGNCGTMFTTRRALKLHLACKHSSKVFVCEICGIDFQWRASLWRHMQGKHNTPLLTSVTGNGEKL